MSTLRRQSVVSHMLNYVKYFTAHIALYMDEIVVLRKKAH